MLLVILSHTISAEVTILIIAEHKATVKNYFYLYKNICFICYIFLFIYIKTFYIMY